MFKTIKKVHFIGIGGSGMSGIALVLHNSGYMVTGSDISKNDLTRHLEESGVKIFLGHKASNVRDTQVVVTSTAVDRNNVEVVEALKRKIPVIPRAEMLAELARLKYTITVAGTHGKTTTTSLLSCILEEAGYDPTIIVGGKLKSLGSGGKRGDGDYLVAEADESDGSFLKLSPTITLVTNIDNDHLDHYKSFEKLKEAFIQHINSVPFYGFSVLCADDPVIDSVLGEVQRKYVTYAIEKKADYTARDISAKERDVSFSVYRQEKKLGTVSLSLFGKHNISNALAAAVCALELGVDIDVISKALGKFSGVSRRLEFHGERDGVLHYDDYAHHPTEIKSTVKALKEMFPGRRLVCFFQPHRYSRTRLLYNELADSLKGIDKLFLDEIYPAGEKPVEGIDTGLIFRALEKNGREAVRVNMKTCRKQLVDELKKNDIFLTMGAGDVCILQDVLRAKTTA